MPMRYRLFIVLCALMLSTAWAQEAGAVNPAPDGSQSAYDIFGLSSEDESSTDKSGDNASPVQTEPAVPAVEAPEGDETALRDEVMRLLAERDALFTEINELKDENSTLAKAAEEADGYRVRTLELEAEVARLEKALALKETELAAAEARIAEITAQLEEEGSRLTEEKARAADAAGKEAAAEARLADADAKIVDIEAKLSDAEARLAASGGDQAAIDKLVAEKNTAIAERESIRLEGEKKLAEKDAALADRDALLSIAGSELSGKDAAIEAKDAQLIAKDETIASRDAELLEIQKRLTAAEKDLADAKTALEAKPAAAPASAVPTAGTPAPAPASDEAASARLAEAVKDAERRVAEISAERDAAVAVRDAAVASREAAETMVRAAEAMRAEAEAALAAALASGTVVRGSPEPVKGATAAPAATAAPVPPASAKTASAGYLSGWSLDTSRFQKKLRAGFDGSLARMGTWKITGQTAAQTDASQYFSRLELPLAQGKASTLYRFKARSTGKGWIGLGLHIFVEDNKKKRGYGEGKSLLVWFTRDKATRGDDATYLQLFRSDTDVVMERMFDAELQDGVASWRQVEIVYDPVAEYIAVSVDGVLRAVYKTFFGRDAGATVSLRTLGGGGSFQDFSAWTE
jgi:hypothetical protein